MNKIKKNREYKAVYNCNNSVADYNLVLFFNKNKDDNSRFGFTCAKKIKKAVDRNRIRRIIKEIVRLNDDKIKQNYDIIFMARVNAVNANYKALEKSFYKVLSRADLLNK
ncbi:ribonuclease P protein component [Sedimentibacter sp. zth1]|uniref:ribonuclease P protein component n=1 Tax=Sedimentibacter sp. zth1 TaxID=2816908 RepID=UPI001A92EFD7|nr:ribonuclease P protein component [Sedimentibacter sp. zth1]QSX05183.1 ribonuclease P protein component [Sedimentibacter sp. zth1]